MNPVNPGRILTAISTFLLPLFGLFIFYLLRAVGSYASIAESPLANFLFFAFLVAYVLLGMAKIQGVRHLSIDIARTALAFLIIALVVVLPLFLGIALRVQTGTLSYANDHALQLEEAARFVRQGENPYAVSYEGTAAHLGGALGAPGLDHLVSLPFEFLITVPFQAASESILGWYDQRLLYLLAFFVSLLVITLAVRDVEVRLICLTIFSLNPFFAFTFIHGYTDALVLCLIVVAGWQLLRKRYLVASMVLGLALASRHYAIFFSFFVILYLVRLGRRYPSGKKRLRFLATAIGPAVLVTAALILPFFLQNPQAFLDDTLRYPAGTLPTSYPIRGFGFSAGLLASGTIASDQAYYPFWVPQLFVVGPLLVLLGVWLYRRANVASIFFGTGLTLFAFLFLSRFFQVNYPGFIFSLVGAGLAFLNDERRPDAEPP